MLARRPKSLWREGGRTFQRQGMLIREVQWCDRCRSYFPAARPHCECETGPLGDEKPVDPAADEEAGAPRPRGSLRHAPEPARMADRPARVA